MRTRSARRSGQALRVGDAVVVRSEAEILATLDRHGELDALPFMPEMLQYCGRRMTVHKVAHKACDTISRTGMRRMRRAVHLVDARCDGAAHGGCEAGCLLYWKEAWVRRADPAAADPGRTAPVLVTVEDLRRATRREPFPDGAPRYACQSTEMLRATPEPVRLKNLGQYRVDVRSGNVGVVEVLRSLAIAVFNRVQLATGRLPAPLRFRGGRELPFLEGGLDGPTPTAHTDLRPGERVRVKSTDDILRTVDRNLANRGMSFTDELALFTGRQARVQRRVHRIVDEKSGRMIEMKNPCVVLEGVVCQGRYSANCPREAPAFWREIWLDRVES